MVGAGARGGCARCETWSGDARSTGCHTAPLVFKITSPPGQPAGWSTIAEVNAQQLAELETPAQYCTSLSQTR